MTDRKVSVITGASKGIDLATAERLKRQGNRAIGLARHAPKTLFPGEFMEVDSNV